MKAVQDALKELGIPVVVGKLKDTGGGHPDAYVTYTHMRTEDQHYDDNCIFEKVYVYLNLWSEGDPDVLQRSIRRLMRAAGFALSSETTTWEDLDGYVLSAYTFSFWQAVDDAAPV